MTSRTTRTCLALLSFLVVLASVAPALGEVPASEVSSTSGVAYDGCVDHPYSYELRLPTGAESWSMDVEVVGPDGLEVGSDFIYDEPTTGTGEILVCLSVPGKHQIVAEGSYYDEDFDEHQLEIEGGEFTLRLPRTKTSIAASETKPTMNQAVTVKVRSKDERPKGYFPNSYAEVVLQRREDGRWKKMKHFSAYTDRKGRVRFKGRYVGPVTMRARTVGTDSYSASTSSKLKLG